MGETFAGRFELIEPLADGGMGSVWVVRDLRDDLLYAGKLLRHSDSSSLLRFIREQATRIDHPHVVTPISWAGEDDRVLFTMPLVRGGSVATLIGDHGPLSGSMTAVLLDQTLLALEAVHAAGIVHRDLKPANLLLRPTGTGRPHLLLTDFGISARVDEPRLTRASQVMGSPGYMSPEQREGADPDVRHDLYSVGMLGLEMLTAHRPPASLGESRDLGRDQPDCAPLIGLLHEACSAEATLRPVTAAAFRERLTAVAPGAGIDDAYPEIADHIATLASRQSPPKPRPAPPPRPSPGPWPTLTQSLPESGPPPAAPPVAPPLTPPAAEPPGVQHRVLALLLVAVALACLAGAAAILL